MAKRKSNVNLLNKLDFSDLEQENINFPALCKFSRTTLGVTRLEMAQKLGISLRAYSYWEQGKRIPKGWQALKLCLIYFYAKEYVAKKDSTEQLSSANTTSDNQAA